MQSTKSFKKHQYELAPAHTQYVETFFKNTLEKVALFRQAKNEITMLFG